MNEPSPQNLDKSFSSEGSILEELPEITQHPTKIRQSVSAEVFGHYNKHSEFHPPVIPKSESQ